MLLLFNQEVAVAESNQKINMKKETYKIHGMHCASCAGTIERILLKTSGVISASVNIASESALIQFNEQVVSESTMAKAVASIGYRLDIETQP